MSCGMPATIRAPSANSRRNARQPADAGARCGPGTRKHSRPCSSAHEAVISAPLRAGASTTTVASARPLMIRLRRGNVPVARARRPVRAPTRPPRRPPTIASASRAWARGYERRRGRRRSPRPSCRRARTVASCAAPSIPIASPETTRRAGRDERGRRSARPWRRPAVVARRVPTTATARSRVERRRVAADEQDVRRHRRSPRAGAGRPAPRW